MSASPGRRSARHAIVLAGVLCTGVAGPRARAQAADLLDRTFGRNGTVTVRLARGIAGWATAVEVDQQGRIVIAGKSRPATDPPAQEQVAVVRLLPDGRRDPAFGDGNGIVRLAEPTMTLNDLAVYPDGRILLAGSRRTGDRTRPAAERGQRMILVRLRSNGRLDESFADGGVAVTSIVRQRPRWDRSTTDREYGLEAEFHAVALAGGKILAAGWAWGRLSWEPRHGPDRWAVLARYNDDGSLDRGYGDPQVEPGFAFEEVQFVSGPVGYGALRALPNGGAVVWGRVAREAVPVHDVDGAVPIDNFLARYDSRGRLNPSFGDGGRVVQRRAYSVDHSSPELFVGPHEAAVLVSARGQVVQVRPDGRMDAAFGTAGEVQLESPVPRVHWVAAMARDGGILAACIEPGPDRNTEAVRLVRLRPDGRIKFAAVSVMGNVPLWAMTVDAEGRAILAGRHRICLPPDRQPRGYNCVRDSRDSLFTVVRLRDPGRDASPPPAVPGGRSRR